MRSILNIIQALLILAGALVQRLPPSTIQPTPK